MTAALVFADYDDNHFYLVQEYYRGGDLNNYLTGRFSKNGLKTSQFDFKDFEFEDTEQALNKEFCLPLVTQQIYSVQIIKAVQFLHSRKYMHRDMKPHQVMHMFF